MTQASKTYSRTTRNSAAHRPRSLRSAARLGFGLLSLLSLSVGQIAHAGTVNWDGTAADWFSNPSHWVGGTAPGMTDDAVNSSTAAITLGQSTTISSFFSNGAFALTGGIFSGSQANAAGTLTVNNVFADNGGTISNFTINQGTGGSLIFNTSGGNVLSGDIINANVDLASLGNNYVRLVGANTVNGNINLGAGGGNGLHLQDGNSVLTLGSTGSLTGFGSVVQDNGGATFNNNGTVNANSAGNTLLINTDNFNNAGTLQVQNGAILATAGNTNITDSGNILVKSGGTATLGQPLTQTAGLTQVDGTLNSPLTLTGGTLKGTGIVNGNVTNTSGTVAAGDSPGTLTVNGAYSQALGGTLDVQFTNAASSLLAVNGMVTTDGTLSVNYIDSIPFTGGFTPFTFLDYTTLATTETSTTGFTQYFSNEIPLSNTTGTILGSNGFIYELINNTASSSLQLSVLTNGAPTPAVPEASTTISFGLLLTLGGGGLMIAKRKKASASV